MEEQIEILSHVVERKREHMTQLSDPLTVKPTIVAVADICSSTRLMDD